jgi:hypothetical protein
MVRVRYAGMVLATAVTGLVTLGAKSYFRAAEILNFRRISATFAHYFCQISAPRKS